MPSILQFVSMSYQDVSETMFLGGTTLTEQTATGFVTRSDAYTVTFTGRNLSYDEAGNLSGGTLETYRVVNEITDIGTADIVVDSNFTLLPAHLFTAALALFASGDETGANALVMRSWLNEFYWHTNYSGDDMIGHHAGETFSSYRGGNTVAGLGGDDTLMLNGLGTLGLGGGGNDHIYGGGGDDTLSGGSGNDWIYNDRNFQGDDSADLIHGGAGNDGIVADQAGDTAYGGLGDDYLFGSYTFGGAGDDESHGRRQDSVLFGGTGNDALHGSGGNDNLSGDGGDDEVFAGYGADTMTGGFGNDALHGSSGNDIVYGGAGADLLIGFTGDDSLFGGAGADRLHGGAGVNVQTGGTGADIFHFRPMEATDTILDFELGQDVIWLKQFHFADAAAVAAIMTDGVAGVSFDFGNGQSLTVVGASAAAIQADLVL
jgi:Ca2+-binding RTX toxin-like protein